MHKIKRTGIPSSLKRYGATWTKDLLDEIARKGSYSKAESKYKTKYNKDPIKRALDEMYGDFCCYCESRITVAGFRRIEHLKPRAKFPEECYSWDNLHYACEVCNSNKTDEWDYTYPIIDPCIDTPTNHLEFRDHLIFPRGNDLRGKTTIEHTELNRNELADARLMIFSLILDIINFAKERAGVQWKSEALKRLDSILTDPEYLTLKEYIKETYLL